MPPPARSSGPALAPVQVTYYRRLKHQCVYPVVVRWKKGAAPTPGRKVTLRLLLAGAQVVPSETTLDAGKPQDHATFQVTPLAKGWLRAQRLASEALRKSGRSMRKAGRATPVVRHAA